VSAGTVKRRSRCSRVRSDRGVDTSVVPIATLPGCLTSGEMGQQYTMATGIQ
jgi:hypothetical protein